MEEGSADENWSATFIVAGTLPTAAVTFHSGSAFQTSAFIQFLSNVIIFVSKIPLLAEGTWREAPEN